MHQPDQQTPIVEHKEEPIQESVPEIVTETTVPPELQHIPESWDHHSQVDEGTSQKIAKAMTKGSFTHFPLDAGKSEADADVAEHLTNHGYEIKDYSKGIATKKIHVGDPSRGIPMREKYVDEKIGSILEKTGATPEVKSAFTNDPARASQKTAEGQHVVISTSPLALAGMSTGTHWDQTSCMRLTGGAHNYKLRDDSEHGTHVAYLVNHDDKTAFKHGEPSNPIARIALKPFHSDDGDTIFRPEGETYGSGSTSFTNAVAQWAVDKYPGKTGVDYEKNSHVYDDTGETNYRAMSVDEVKEKIDNWEPIADRRGQALDKGVIDAAINHAETKFKAPDNEEDYDKDHRKKRIERFVGHMAQVGNLGTQHVAKLHRLLRTNDATTGIAMDKLASEHGDKFSTNAINQYNDKVNGSLPPKMLMAQKLPDHILNSITPASYHFVRRSKLKPEHIDHMVNYVVNDDGSPTLLNTFHDKLTGDHIKQVLGMTMTDANDVTRPHMGYSHISAIMKSPNFSKEHHDILMDNLSKKYIKPENAWTDHNAQYRQIAGLVLNSSPYATAEDAEKIEHPSAYSELSKNEHLPKEEFKKIKDKYIEAVGNLKEGDNKFNMPKMGGMSSIPKGISDHMTDSDYDKIADKHIDMTFEDPKHSHKHLDKIFDKVEASNDKFTEHMDHMYATVDGYDEDEDDHLKTLKDQMHKHLENYANNIGSHISKHVESEEDRDIPKNWDELSKMQDRLNIVNVQLDQYKPGENADDQEHWDDNFDEHDRHLHKLSNYEENDDNW